MSLFASHVLMLCCALPETVSRTQSNTSHVVQIHSVRASSFLYSNWGRRGYFLLSASCIGLTVAVINIQCIGKQMKYRYEITQKKRDVQIFFFCEVLNSTGEGVLDTPYSRLVNDCDSAKEA